MRAGELLSKNASFHGRECPECGERGNHPDNGSRGTERSYCCTSCGAHWDAELYLLSEEEFEFLNAEAEENADA